MENVECRVLLSAAATISRRRRFTSGGKPPRPACPSRRQEDLQRRLPPSLLDLDRGQTDRGQNRVFSQAAICCPCRYSKWATGAGAPICRRAAIQDSVIVVSRRRRAAIITWRGSPLRSPANSAWPHPSRANSSGAIPPAHHMVDCSRILHSDLPGHLAPRLPTAAAWSRL
jgi:hypothetical protein